MIELILGGPNSDLPNPNSNRLNKTAPYVDFSFSVENQIKALAFKAKPTELNTRLPYLSDSLPLIGPMTRTTSSMGMSKTPALKALYPSIN